MTDRHTDSGGAHAWSAVGVASAARMAAIIDGEGWQRLVDGLREAVVLVDRGDLVCAWNTAAATLFPHLAVGLPFDGARAELGPRSNWRREDLDGRWYAWYFTEAVQQAAQDPGGDVDVAAASFLNQAHRRLALSLDTAATLRAVVELAVPALADHCVVVLPRPRGRVEWWRNSDGVEPVTTGRTTTRAAETVPGLPDVLAGRVADTAVSDLGEGAWGCPEDFGQPGDALAVGLPADGRTAGALVLLRRAARDGFSSSEAQLAREFATSVALALEAASRHGEQAQMIDVLRTNLLPPSLPSVAGVVLGSAYQPAQPGSPIGGDFYDVHLREDGTAAFTLGDVCGNGLEAAVQSGRVRQSLHALLLVEQRPAQLLHLLNAALRAAGSKLFTTLVVGTLSQHEGGDVELGVAVGGHPPPMVLREDGTVEDVVAHGGIVGLLPEVRFHPTSVTLRPGESLLLYSDGYTEARARHDRSELFGDVRLRAALRECVGLTADATAAKIEATLSDWLGDGEHDDMTLLVVQALPATG
jgi:sigma-B regulation protein RsbU (phosphoserine phosphatase)